MDVADHHVPDDFRCPISLEVMRDPVILPSGHTFDRPSILRWLESGRCTCPVTNLPLPPGPSLIPNHALRSLIASSLAATSSSPPPLALDALSFPAEASALQSVLLIAERGGRDSRRRIGDSGVTQILICHAAAGDDKAEIALRALLYLSLDGDDARVGLVADGAVDALASALSYKESRAAALAATVLTSLATVDVNKCTIGAHPAAVQGLCSLLRASAAPRARREAATALYELCKLPENRRRAVNAGAVLPLVSLAASGSERAVEVLGLLAKCPEGRLKMVKIEGFVRVLVGVIRRGTQRGMQHALFALNLVCSENNCVAAETIKEGALDLCEALLVGEGGKISKNAAELAQTLEKLGVPDA